MSYTMTEEHKEALAEGRRDGRAVKLYLEALENHRPKRGRKSATETPEGISKRLAEIEEELSGDDVNALQRLQLAQERLTLTERLESLDDSDSIEELEDDFIDVAARYAERKGISYDAFREMGVAADVLKRAGLSRR